MDRSRSLICRRDAETSQHPTAINSNNTNPQPKQNRIVTAVCIHGTTDGRWGRQIVQPTGGTSCEHPMCCFHGASKLLEA